jgi:hypothetical protein
MYFAVCYRVNEAKSMNDKQEGDNEKQQRASEATKSPPPSLPNEKEARKGNANPERCKTESSTAEPPKSKWQRFVMWSWPMEFSDAVMILLTIFIAVGTIASAVAIGFQWHEMHEGGKQTEALICAARINAGAAQSFAISAESINKGIGDAVTKLAAQVQATASVSATAKETLHTSERAYISIGAPQFNFASKRIDVPLLNGGRIPSGAAEIMAYEVTMNTSETSDPGNMSVAIEKHWGRTKLSSIGASPHMSISIETPEMVTDKVNSGHQKVVFAGVITYNDGFPKSRQQNWEFCALSFFDSKDGQASLMPCTPSDIIPKLIVAIQYPLNEYHYR